MNQTFASKLVLVSGGSSGIGLATAIQFYQRGASLILLSRRQEALDSAKDKIKDIRASQSQFVETLAVDLRDYNALKEHLQPLLDQYGTPDIVMHSAGVVYPAIFEKTSIEQFHWMMDTNYFAAVNLFQIIIPLMKQRRYGQLIAMGSAASFLSIWGYSAYSGSKFAIRGLCDSLRCELKPYNVQISVVFPPDTDTPQLAYENQFKPAITKEISGTIKPFSADFVAESIIKGILKKKYVIIPDFQTKIVYWLTNILGSGVFKLVDLFTRNAIKKHGLEE